MEENLSLIGLNINQTKEIQKELNLLLSELHVFYINTRGYHWNIKGDNFFELHLKFEEIYNDIAEKIDEVAERILTLGATPLHSYSEYLKNAKIKEDTDISDGKLALKKVNEFISVLIILEKKILNLSQDCQDEGTAALMSDYIREQEKSIWMFSSFLG